ncbi:nuclease-related domain-containing DEAD/DEAH box helicase [Pyxidicoccus xibeiensis]|uniref:nuclease-related domain-containing DEAD/DEAH box helicase n=1 Tax=Pyxidicoccus xibeiensis TaxID=2906759 RepID=UPI0020A81FB5|nr:NERD domain-containing protein [Pyxidicoccus xibeiensis]MCP3138690.1 NERD domain-containing protein [Pyxidicoccus xibeiensis]
MRMIPPVISNGTPSAAEREVFSRLARTDFGPGARVLHSLNLSEHDYKRVGELDFVVVCERGVLVLEVKGGGVACGDDGIWTFTDRHGKTFRKSEGPFQQARSGMFSLKRRLGELLGEERIAPVLFGFGVLFPDCEFSERGVEWAPEFVFDARLGARGEDLRAYLNKVFQYWESKERVSFTVPGELSKDIAHALRPSFDRIPSLRVKSHRLTQMMEELTEEQYVQLDWIEENPRSICMGGAGTGKTFLAAELARRQAARGKRVLVVCANPVLAGFLGSRLGDSNISVVSLDRLRSGTGGSRTAARPRFDALIVDEGQDLLNMDALGTLDAELSGGLAQGEWCFLLDANRQTGLSGRYEREAHDHLLDHRPAVGRLSRNCRNTEQIVTQTRLLTASDLGKPVAGEGPPVVFEYYDSDEQLPRAIDGYLGRLREEGIATSEITILLSRPLASSSLQRTEAWRRRAITVIDAAVAADWPARGLTCAGVADFKGLENKFILLIDIELEGAPDRVNNLMYVGMSRAQVGLWMAVPRSAKARLAKLAEGNSPKVLPPPSRSNRSTPD